MCCTGDHATSLLDDCKQHCPGWMMNEYSTGHPSFYITDYILYQSIFDVHVPSLRKASQCAPRYSCEEVVHVYRFKKR